MPDDGLGDDVGIVNVTRSRRTAAFDIAVRR